MLSTSFTALIFASITAFAVVKGTPPTTHQPTEAAGNSTAITANQRLSGVLTACRDHDYGGECNTVSFVENGCHALPNAQKNNVDSVRIPTGWACTFYDDKNGCIPSKFRHTTILSPGSRDLKMQNFNDRADYVQCVILCR
ncbi:hypothetical protein C8R43DRAFT_1138806 [Mycena crocata]|nr:hypothetical protein C8R43DRAFT_1138806 [Mycena crocata]